MPCFPSARHFSLDRATEFSHYTDNLFQTFELDHYGKVIVEIGPPEDVGQWDAELRDRLNVSRSAGSFEQETHLTMEVEDYGPSGGL